MTFIELVENIKHLKFTYSYCNLFNEYYKFIGETGLYVKEKSNFWEVYYIERLSTELACIFYNENNLYEYIYCYFKKVSDSNCWFGGLMTQYPKDLINKLRRFKIPDYEYSFDGEILNYSLFIEPKKIVDNGENLHGVIKREDGTNIFEIGKEYFKKNSGIADAFEVIYNNGKDKISCGVFFNENDAYDFLFYLVMRKYVSIKKRWW